MAEICEAICVARGRIFPNVSKDSARKICIPPTRSSGKKTIATTMIPMPPSHCRIPRQSKIPRGISSRPVITVAPVVVRPDIASKIASMKDSSDAPMINGKAPNMGKATQTPVVSKKVCWILSPSLTPFWHDSATSPPTSMVITALSAKAGQCPRPSTISITIGASIVSPSAATRRPITYPTGRRSNMSAGLA